MSNKGVDATAAVSTLGKRKFDASASSSTADPVAAGGVYDVFLSFHGEDTRKDFTDYLYTSLTAADIRTFIDKEDLKIGEEIGDELLKAIKESNISIPIFSQNYASSKWCLNELQEMVECHEKQGQMIHPIFYDVTPSDVRDQSGSYEMAFIQHEKNFNFSPDKVQKWRDALRVVGKLKGLELAKETNGYQGKLVKLAVEKVFWGLKKKYTYLPPNLVGMDNHIVKLTRLLQVDSNDVHVVGILGMGGLGKTTIAKVIYNRLCHQFEGQCFLDDVREKLIRNEMVDLQKQLISNILNLRDISVSNVDEGKEKISKACGGKKLLIVLDDVEEESQVEMLMGDLSRFGQQSLIILTTRNERVLKVICERENPHVVYSCYKPELMDDHHALQLFSKYAFKKDSPLQGYKSLSEKVVRIADGLPLVLRVLGSRFYAENDTDLWEESLMKLQKIPDGDVMKKLKFSFDALDYTQQQIFLDIACLFIGYSKTRASYMWDDCGFYPIKGIRVLVSRSLVTVGDDDILRMHDQLRDLGRHIVNEEGSLKEKPGEQSRLWGPEMAMQVLEEHQGTSNIKALRLGPHGSVGESHFHDLPNLRYLCINMIDNIEGDFKHLLPHLRWLECTDMIKFSPNNLNMKNLVILRLSSPHPCFYDVTKYGQLDDWDGWSYLKEANKLKVLDLSYCIDLQTLPNLSNLTKLVELDLSWCDKLTEIPGLEKLESLQVLNLRGCKSLETLPNISNFTKLKVFNAFYCHKLIRIEGLHKLLSLTNLDLRICSSLKEGVGDLSNLNKLQVLVGAPGLDTTDFSNFKKLNSLWIYRNNRTEIQNLDGLEALEDLDICECPSIERLPNLTCLKRLKNLRITECEQLTEIRDLGELKSLEVIYIEFCSSLKLIEIESRARLDSLKVLRISYCKSLERLADLPNFGTLQRLEVVNCDKLQVVEGLGVIQSLECIEISRCVEFQKLPNLQGLKKLEKLILRSLEKITAIHGLEELKSLEELSYLHIHKCPYIERMPNLTCLKRLKNLRITECEQLTEIRDLGELKSLEVMYIRSCSSLKLIEIESRARLDSLKVLRISDCMSLERLAVLPNFGTLQVLEVSRCNMLQEVEGLGVIQSLECIEISRCVEFQKLPNLQGLKKLKKLTLWSLEKITAIHGLEELKSLEELNISRCSSIVAIPNLSNLQNLKDLNVSGCVRLSEIHGLEELKSLSTLRIFPNQELPYLPYLPNVHISSY